MNGFNPWDLARIYGIPIDNLNRVNVIFTTDNVVLHCRTSEGESVIYSRSLGPLLVNHGQAIDLAEQAFVPEVAEA